MEREGDPENRVSGLQLIVGAPLLAEMARHASDRLPFESGGLLLGQKKSEALVARRFVPLESVLPSPERYRAGAAETVRAVARAARSGQRVVATVHSHPGGSETPSQSDLQWAFAYKDCAHLLVVFSRGLPSFRAYEYVRSKQRTIFIPVTLVADPT